MAQKYSQKSFSTASTFQILKTKQKQIAVHAISCGSSKCEIRLQTLFAPCNKERLLVCTGHTLFRC